MKTSVYLPDALADEAAALGISISSVVQDAVRAAIRRRTAGTTPAPGLGVWLTVDGGTPQFAPDALVSSLVSGQHHAGDILHLPDVVLIVEGREMFFDNAGVLAVLVHTTTIPAVEATPRPILVAVPSAADQAVPEAVAGE